MRDVYVQSLNELQVSVAQLGDQVAFALGELSPSFGDPAKLAMIALLDGDDGFARLVLPGDHRGGRFVSNIVDMKLIDATAMVAPVPLPASIAATRIPTT